MSVVALRPREVPEASYVPECPVREDETYIRYGWRNLLWRTVREVGEPIQLEHGWLVPVRYGNRSYAILHFRFPQRGVREHDDVIEIISNSESCSWILRNAVGMPRIKIEGDALRVLTLRSEESTDQDFGWIGDESVYYNVELVLYGVLGPRDGRQDEILPKPPTWDA